MDLRQLEFVIEAAFDDRDNVTVETKGEVREAVEETLNALDSGALRVAEKIEGAWIVNQWAKKAVLLGFRLNPMAQMGAAPGGGTYWDKVAAKWADWGQDQWVEASFGRCQAALCAILPTLRPMLSSCPPSSIWALMWMRARWSIPGPPSAPARKSEKMYLSGVGIGGVLEPLQAGPVIIEDNCFIGARSEVVEGVVVEEGAVLAMGSSFPPHQNRQS